MATAKQYRDSRAALQALALSTILIDTEALPNCYSFFVGSTDVTEDVACVMQQANPGFFEFTPEGFLKCNTFKYTAAQQLDYIKGFLAQGLGFPNMAFASSDVAGPVNTVAPAITGAGHTTNLESCSTGTWTGTATIAYTYQWMRDGVAIAGQTAATYTLAVADQTHAITCRVTATNTEGVVSAVSNSIVALA